MNITEFDNPLAMVFSSSISIIYKNKSNKNQETRQITKINLVIKDEKHREPYDFYINDDGKIRVFANGFIDATDKAFIDYIDNKIDEYNKYGKNYDPTLFNKFNQIDKTQINTEEALYYDDENNKRLFNNLNK